MSASRRKEWTDQNAVMLTLLGVGKLIRMLSCPLHLGKRELIIMLSYLG